MNYISGIANRPVNKIFYNKHRHRKNNDLVAAMFAMYNTGKSLAEIGKVYRKTRQAVYDVFKSRGIELRHKELKDLQILDGIRFTWMKGGYLRGTVGNRRMTIHKYVWEKANGRLQKGFVIYHKDGNRQNNNLGNLKLVALSDMPKIFNPNGNNQFAAVK